MSKTTDFTRFLAFVAVFWWPVFAGADQGPPRSDLWLKAQLVTVYALNEHLNPFKISVEVQDGVARLSGTVENEIEKELAEELARGIKGIHRVHNELHVDASTQPDSRRGAFARMVEDANITARVKSQLLWNANTHGLDIHVDTENGHVRMSGNVNNPREAELAMQIARNTRGVQTVTNLIQISPEPPTVDRLRQDLDTAVEQLGRVARDGWISARVRALLVFDRALDGSDIEVTTEDGVVTLRGTAKDLEQKRHLLDVVGDIVGVRAVRDRVMVRGQFTTLKHGATALRRG